MATRISTTRYSRTKVTLSILPDESDWGHSPRKLGAHPLAGEYRKCYPRGRNEIIGGRSSSETEEVRGV
jgi:hypothetical protein